MEPYSKHLIQGDFIKLYPSLAVAVGLNEAIILQEIHFRRIKFGKEREGKLWIYNTYDDWQNNFPFWSIRTIRRILDNLKEMGVVEATDRFNKYKMDRTLWYAINDGKLNELTNHLAILPTWSAENGKSEPEWDDDVDKLSMSGGGQIVQVDEDKLDSSNQRIPNLIIPSKNTSDDDNSLRSLSSATPQQEMFGAICEAIGWDYHVISDKNKGQVAQAVKVLSKANYTVEDIRRFMVEVWFKDWRWEKNQQYPTLSQLREEIGKIRSVVPSAAPAKKKTGAEGYKELLRERGISP